MPATLFRSLARTIANPDDLFHSCPGWHEPSVRQNRVVLAPVAGVKLPVAHSIQPDRLSHRAGSDGGKRNSSPGRARHKPSNHCAGNAGVFRLYLYARVRISLHHAHGTAGAACTRHSLHPLISRVDTGKPRTPCAAGTQTCVRLKEGNPRLTREPPAIRKSPEK